MNALQFRKLLCHPACVYAPRGFELHTEVNIVALKKIASPKT
jgi:hypothetical protein